MLPRRVQDGDEQGRGLEAVRIQISTTRQIESNEQKGIQNWPRDLRASLTKEAAEKHLSQMTLPAPRRHIYAGLTGVQTTGPLQYSEVCNNLTKRDAKSAVDACHGDINDSQDLFNPQTMDRLSDRASVQEPLAASWRQPRSLSAGCESTCYVFHDSGGRPVLQLLARGFALRRKSSPSTTKLKNSTDKADFADVVIVSGATSGDQKLKAESEQGQVDTVRGDGDQRHAGHVTQRLEERRRKQRSRRLGVSRDVSQDMPRGAQRETWQTARYSEGEGRRSHVAAKTTPDVTENVQDSFKCKRQTLGTVQDVQDLTKCKRQTLGTVQDMQDLTKYKRQTLGTVQDAMSKIYLALEKQFDTGGDAGKGTAVEVFKTNHGHVRDYRRMRHKNTRSTRTSTTALAASELYGAIKKGKSGEMSYTGSRKSIDSSFWLLDEDNIRARTDEEKAPAEHAEKLDNVENEFGFGASFQSEYRSQQFGGDTTSRRGSQDLMFGGDTASRRGSPDLAFGGDTLSRRGSQDLAFGGDTASRRGSQDLVFGGDATPTRDSTEPEFGGDATPTRDSTEPVLSGDATPTKGSTEPVFGGDATPTKDSTEPEFGGDATPTRDSTEPELGGDEIPTTGGIDPVHPEKKKSARISEEFSDKKKSKVSGKKKSARISSEVLDKKKSSRASSEVSDKKKSSRASSEVSDKKKSSRASSELSGKTRSAAVSPELSGKTRSAAVSPEYSERRKSIQGTSESREDDKRKSSGSKVGGPEDDLSVAGVSESLSSSAEGAATSESESEALGTIVYQHVARYVCIGGLRVAGGVRILFDAALKQSYLQIISPICEVYITFYGNNVVILNSSSAAGVAWAGAVVTKPKDAESDENSGSVSKNRQKGTPEVTTSADNNGSSKPEAAKSVIDTAHVVFCDPHQAQRFRTAVEVLKSTLEPNNGLMTPFIAEGLDPCCPCSSNVPSRMPYPRGYPQAMPPPCVPFQTPDPEFSQQPSRNNSPFPQRFQDQNHITQHMYNAQNQEVSPSRANQSQYILPRQYSTGTQYKSSDSLPPSASWTPTDVMHSTYPTEPPSENNEMAQTSGGNYPPICCSGKGRVTCSLNMPSIPSHINSTAVVGSAFCANLECPDPYSYLGSEEKLIFCAPACLVSLNSDMTWMNLQKGCLKIKQSANSGGYYLMLESNTQTVSKYQFITADTVFMPSDKTQFGFTYSTVTSSDFRGNVMEHFLVSFMNRRHAGLFKCTVDNIKMILRAETTEDDLFCNCPEVVSGFNCSSNIANSWPRL